MKTIIAGKCSSPFRKKNAERNYIATLGERKYNLQGKSAQFYGQEDSSTEKEHPATDSFSFYVLPIHISIENIKDTHAVSEDME